MINFSNGNKLVDQQHFSIDEWNDYASSHVYSTVYHLTEWSTVLEKSFGYTPFHLFSKNKDGKLSGVLPLVLTKSFGTRNHLVSLPFSHMGGPIADSEIALLDLQEKAKNICDLLKCKYVEIKTMNNLQDSNIDSLWINNGFEINKQFSTYLLDLSIPEKVWKKLDPKSVRWAIGKARKDGVIVKKSNSVIDINHFYHLNLKTKKRIGVPGHPKCLFTNMFNILGDKCTLYLAELNGEIIAGIITIKFKDTVLYAYGASDDKYRTHQPNSLLVWTAIEESCNEGYRYFDFGRTSPAEQNVTSFKKHWGTGERTLIQWFSMIPVGNMHL
jgi:hypothetical protein